MAKTIYQRIALEGGKEIAKQLRALGKDGEAAFVEIAAAAKKLQGDLGKLGGSFKDLGGSLATVGKRLGIAGAAAAAATVGVVALAKSGTEMADAATKQAQAIGLAVDEYGRLSWAASQSGVDQATLATAMGRLNQTIGDVTEGSESAASKFAAVGVSVTDAFGKVKPTEQLMGELADKFAAMPNGAQKSALAIDLFGRSGAQLIPFLNAGSAGLRDLGAEAERLGVVFTKEQGTLAEGMNDALAALGKAVSGTKAQIGLLFAPSITQAARALQKLIEDNRIAVQDFVERGLAKAVPLAEDFINAVIGNDAAVQNMWILEARDAVFQFANAVQAAVTGIIVPAYQSVIAVADSVASAINGIFGQEFTGQQILIAAAVAKFVGLFGVLSASVSIVVGTFKTLGSAWTFAAAAYAKSGAIWAGITVAAKTAGTALAALVSWPALIIAGIVAAGVAIYVFWDEIVAGASRAWDLISTGAAALWNDITSGVSAAWDFIAGTFSGAGAQFSEWGQQAARLFADGLSALGSLVTAIWDGIAQAGIVAAAGIARGWAGLADLFSGIWRALTSGARNAWDYLRDGFGTLVDWIGDLFDGMVRRIQSAWNRIKSIGSSIKKTTSSIFDYSRDDDTQGFATGGYVRGAGTGTSDSILARLSNGEFVIRAAAVRHYGPELLAALNGLKLPKLPGFSVGGLVQGVTSGMSLQMPRFADGGLVAVPASGGRPVTINIDGQAYQMSASDDVIDRLGRHATSRRLKSAGRKPGWVAA